jgi:hypothetical protein
MLDMESFRQAAEKTGISLGYGPLNLINLVWLGLLSALHLSKSFAEILTFTLKLLEDSEDWNQTPLGRACQPEGKGKKCRSKHDPRGTQPGAISEEAFVQARKRMPLEFWLAILMFLGQRFQTQYPQHAYWKGFRLLAIDGTEISLERWKPLLNYFGAHQKRAKFRTPQARMVMLCYPLARIPLRYVGRMA